MGFIDISLPLQGDLPVWPGDPKILLKWLSRIDHGSMANVTELEMSVHSGTHIDAPFHFNQNGTTIDKIDLNVLIGSVTVVDVPHNILTITSEYLKSLELPECERILFKTKNTLLWERKEKRFYPNYVGIDPSGAQWLVDKNIKLVGIDYLSISPFDCTVEPHKLLLGAGIVVLEGINLSNAASGNYKLICLPLNLQGREGSPARVILETII